MKEGYSRAEHVEVAGPLLEVAKNLVAELKEGVLPMESAGFPGFYLADTKQDPESFMFVGGFKIEDVNYFIYQIIQEE